MTRVWFWAPCWYWYGPKTLWPIHLGGDEYGRRTLLLGWTVTGRAIAAISRPGRLYPPDSDLMSDWGCCALDRDGAGHDGPCGWKCSWCMGTGRCLDCDGTGGPDDVVPCHPCDGTGACIHGCYEGWVSDE